nr:hypothetical protein [uncultured Roseateles sp.]
MAAVYRRRLVKRLLAEIHLLAVQALDSTQLGQQLTRQWPDAEPASPAVAVRCREALIQLPPADLWLGRLLDGFIQGTWKMACKDRQAMLEIAPFHPLSRRERQALGFAAPEATTRELRFNTAHA